MVFLDLRWAMVGWGLGLVLFSGLVERWEWRDLNIGGEDGLLGWQHEPARKGTGGGNVDVGFEESCRNICRCLCRCCICVLRRFGWCLVGVFFIDVVRLCPLRQGHHVLGTMVKHEKHG